MGLKKHLARLEACWRRLTAQPRSAHQAYWGLFCLGGLVASLLAAGILEELDFHRMTSPFGDDGRWAAALAISRILSGPSYCFDQYCLRLDWLLWEEIMLYSAAQWLVIWLAGWPLAARTTRRSFKALVGATLVALAFLGFCVADAPFGSVDFMLELRRYLDGP